MNLKYICNLWKHWVLLLTLHNRIKDEWLLPYELYKKGKNKGDKKKGRGKFKWSSLWAIHQYLQIGCKMTWARFLKP